MEPRSLDRGNDLLGELSRRLLAASMEPRSLDRGNADVAVLTIGVDFASMEPRSLDRGNSSLASERNEKEIDVNRERNQF